MNQILIELNGEIAKSTITCGKYNILLSVIKGTGRQKISKGIEDQNHRSTNLT